MPRALCPFVSTSSRLVVDFNLKCPSDMLKIMTRHDSFLGCRTLEMRRLGFSGGEGGGGLFVDRLIPNWGELVRGFESIVVTLPLGVGGS